MSAAVGTTPTLKARAGKLDLVRLLDTPKEIEPLVMRLVLGGVMLPHGGQHFAGWFSGYGFSGTYAWMTGTVGAPGWLAAVAIVSEFVAPYLLIAGLGGRVAAFLLGAILAVAASTHASAGFFMNWFGKASGEGFEYHILGVGLAVALMIRGSGAFSLDRVLVRRLTRGRTRTE